MKLSTKIGTMQWLIIALTLVTATVHLLMPDMILKLNGIGYLGLLAAYFLVLPIVSSLQRDWIRWAFIAYAAVTIVAYFVRWGAGGLTEPVGIATKVVEVILIVLLLRDR